MIGFLVCTAGLLLNLVIGVTVGFAPVTIGTIIFCAFCALACLVMASSR